MPFHYELFHPRTRDASTIRTKGSVLCLLCQSKIESAKYRKEVQSSDHRSARCPRRASGCAKTQSSFSRSGSDLHLNSTESCVKLHINAFAPGLEITQMFVTEPSSRVVSRRACFPGVCPSWKRVRALCKICRC